MRMILSGVAFAATVTMAAGAFAQSVPNWSVAKTCGMDATCPPFERRARADIAGVWDTLPPDARSTCIADAERVEKSYRLLSDCLANEMQRRAGLGSDQR